MQLLSAEYQTIVGIYSLGKVTAPAGEPIYIRKDKQNKQFRAESKIDIIGGVGDASSG